MIIYLILDCVNELLHYVQYCNNYKPKVGGVIIDAPM